MPFTQCTKVKVLSLLTDPVALINPAITTLIIYPKEIVSHGGIGVAGDATVEGLLDCPIPSVISSGNISDGRDWSTSLYTGGRRTKGEWEAISISRYPPSSGGSTSPLYCVRVSLCLMMCTHHPEFIYSCLSINIIINFTCQIIIFYNNVHIDVYTYIITLKPRLWYQFVTPPLSEN